MKTITSKQASAGSEILLLPKPRCVASLTLARVRLRTKDTDLYLPSDTATATAIQNTHGAARRPAGGRKVICSQMNQATLAVESLPCEPFGQKFSSSLKWRWKRVEKGSVDCISSSGFIGSFTSAFTSSAEARTVVRSGLQLRYL